MKASEFTNGLPVKHRVFGTKARFIGPYPDDKEYAGVFLCDDHRDIHKDICVWYYTQVVPDEAPTDTSPLPGLTDRLVDGRLTALEAAVKEIISALNGINSRLDDLATDHATY